MQKSVTRVRLTGFLKKLHGSIEDKFPCRYFLWMGKKQKLNNMGLQRKIRLPDTQFLQNEYLRASFFPIDPYSAFYALFAANLVSHNSVFLHRPKTQNAHGGRNVMPRCLSEGVDIFLKSVERQGGANRTFKASGCCHGWQLEPCPYGLEPLLTFRENVTTSRQTSSEGHSVRRGRSVY